LPLRGCWGAAGLLCGAGDPGGSGQHPGGVHALLAALGVHGDQHEAAGIAEHGDFRPYATAIEKLASR